MTKTTSGLSRPPGASVAGPSVAVHSPAAAPAPGGRVRGRWWAMAAIAVSFLVVGLDSYIVVTALPTFSVRLGASESQLQWITAAYMLAWAGLLLPIGKLGDKIGRRRLLTAGLALFGIASVAASLVSTAGELIALRATRWPATWPACRRPRAASRRPAWPAPAASPRTCPARSGRGWLTRPASPTPRA